MQVPSRDTTDAPAGPIWWGTAAGVVALCVITTVFSSSKVHEALYTPTVLVLAGAFGAVVWRRKLQPFAGWMTFAAGLALLALGDAVYGAPMNTDVGSTGLSWADPLYLIGSMVLVVGALRVKSAYVGEGDREALIDAASIGLAAAVLLWQPLIEPRFNLADTPVLARLVSGSYPVFDVVVAAMMLWLLLSTRRWSPTMVLLVLGAAFYLAADLAYSVRIDRGTIDDPSLAWLDTLWLIAYGLYLLAAMHPSIRSLGRAETDDDPPISRGRLALSGLTLLAPIVALVIAGTELSHLLVAVGAEAVLVVLVLLRLSDLAAGERRARQAVLDRERYFRSLVQNSSEAMMVLDADGVVRDASPAVRTLLAVAPTDLVGHRPGEAVPGIDHRAVESMVRVAVATPGEVITGEVLVTTSTGTRWLEMRTRNLLGESAVAGVVVNLHDVTARRQVQADLERMAFADALTGLPNRALFQDRLDQLLNRRDPPDLAVVYCDLDRFKSVNDRFGHAEGDRLLEVTAGRLAAVVRNEDTVARLGGDEFAVLIHGPDSLEVAEEVADRIVEELRRPLLVGAEPVPGSVSVGVAFARGGSADGARGLMHSADEAMYRAKRAGGDRVVVLDTPAPDRAPTVGRGRSGVA